MSVHSGNCISQLDLSAGSPDQEFVVRSGPQVVNEVVFFPIGSMDQSLSLEIVNDTVALENTEIFNLTLGSVSDTRVQIGARSVTEISIIDDDGEWGHPWIRTVCFWMQYTI